MSIKTQDAEEVAQNWSRVDWDNLLEKLSKAVEAIDVRQDESEKGRQHLLAESAHFRENTDKGLRKAALPLIKAFQGEVDRLTLRAKAAEAVVIDVCRKCTLVPDPSQYLEQIPSLTREVDRLRSAEEQLNLLKRQLNELREEYGDLQNQELTIRQLREQVKELETKSDSNVQAILSEKEKELRLELEAFKKEMSNKQDELTAENKRLTNAVTDLETKNKETNRILEETKLKVVKKEAVDDATLEMVTKDLENALQRAAEAEKDVQRLQYELERIGRSSMTSDEGVAEDSPLIRTKNIQIHKLLEKNKNLSFKLTELETESKRRIDELTQELERQVELVEQLRAQLQAQADYEDIKKELRILRSVEFGEESADGAGSIMTNGVNTSATATAEVQLGGRLKALDELLVGKNRKLQDENVELRMRNQSLEERLASAETIRDELGVAVERQRELIARLEADLLSLHTVLPRSRADGADADEAAISNSGEYSTIKMLAQELAVPIGQQLSTEEATKDVLSIISAQRDRLHHRVEELERELSIQKQSNTYLQSERDKIREDNVQLYGKIKFLQSYQNNNRQTSLKMDNDETEARYENEYERYLDPFRKFSLQEKQRKYGQLRTYDKAALGLGQWLMSSGQSRAIFFLYLMLLHLLVFLVLYRFAYTESCQRDFQADCIVKFQQHMSMYHPDSSHGHG